jgi:hypothetical protein
MSEREREVQAADICNGTIAGILEQVDYLGAESMIIDQKASHIP